MFILLFLSPIFRLLNEQRKLNFRKSHVLSFVDIVTHNLFRENTRKTIYYLRKKREKRRKKIEDISAPSRCAVQCSTACELLGWPCHEYSLLIEDITSSTHRPHPTQFGTFSKNLPALYLSFNAPFHPLPLPDPVCTTQHIIH